MPPTPPEPYAALRTAFLARVNEAGGFPRRDVFFRIVRRLTGRPGPERAYYPKLKAGDPAPRYFVEAAVRWFADAAGERIDPGAVTVARATPEPTTAHPFDPYRPGRGGWGPLLSWATERIRPAGEYIVPTVAGVELAAAAVARCVGRHTLGRVASADALRQAGEARMGRPWTALAAQFRQLWEFDPRTVLVSPVGITVTAPVTADAYQRFVAGRCSPFDLDATVCQLPTDRLVVLASAETTGGLSRSQAAVLVAQMVTQHAALLPPLAGSAVRPRIATFGGTDVNLRRSSLYGYMVAEATTPEGMAIVEIRPSDGGRATDEVKRTILYESCLGGFRIWQYVNRPEDETED